MIFFEEHNFLVLMDKFINLFFASNTFGAISKKSLPNSRWGHKGFFLCFFPRGYILLSFIFRFMIHFELIFVYGAKLYIHVYLFAYRYPNFPVLLRRLFFLHWIIFVLLSKDNHPYMCGLFDYLLFPWSVCLYIYTSILEKETYSSFLPEKSHGQRELGRLQSNGSQRVGHNWVTKHTHQYHTGLITVVFESLNQVVLVFIFSWVVLAIVGPLYLHMNFKITLSISTNKAAGILSDIALSLSIYLGEN